MPKPSQYKGKGFKPTLFNKIQAQIEQAKDSNAILGLHVGDTWFDLPGELSQPLDNEPWQDRVSRYGETQGWKELRKKLYIKSWEINHLPIQSEEEIQITFGATGALYLAMRRLLEPGSEILTLSPYWTILRVVASSAGVRLVEVPVFEKLASNQVSDLGLLLSSYLTDKTKAIYFNSPNNPSGVLLHKKHLEAIAQVAKQYDLWVFADEAYEDFVWIEEPYTCIASLPDMWERTISIFSMSKSYAAAGLRLGYIACPVGVAAALNATMVGVGYEPNRPGQLAWIRALANREKIIGRLREAYRLGLKAAQENIPSSIPYLRPEGGFYLFLDLRKSWKGLSEEEKFSRMLKAGVVMSPGEAFGKEYEGWARFCFTCEPPERIAEAAKRLALLL